MMKKIAVVSVVSFFMIIILMFSMVCGAFSISEEKAPTGQNLNITSGESSDLATFALQFVGENHNRFTTYKSKNSQAFGADWCAMFVSYCCDNLGYIDSGKIFWYNGCTTAYNQMLAEGKFKYSKCYNGNYVPVAGDIIFFTYDGSTSYHTGIVTSCDGSTVKTVEGNTGMSSVNPYWMGSTVCVCYYDINTSKILGYYPMSTKE